MPDSRDPKITDSGLQAARVEGAPEGGGWMAVPFRVTGTPQEIINAAEAFNTDLGQLLKRHPAIAQVENNRDALQALEHGAAISQALLEQELARQAGQN